MSKFIAICLFLGLVSLTNGASNSSYTCATATLQESDDLQISVLYNTGDNGTRVQITLIGPDSQWFGVGFGNVVMDGTYSIDVDSSGDVSERTLGNHVIGTSLTDIITVESDTTVDDSRVLVLSRKMVWSGDYYTFMDDDTNIEMIWATSSDTSITNHGNSNSNRGAKTVALMTTMNMTDCEISAMSSTTGGTTADDDDDDDDSATQYSSVIGCLFALICAIFIAQ